MQYRENKLTWKQIFWKMWAKTQIFNCRTCNQLYRWVYLCLLTNYFRLDLGKSSCKYHPKTAKFRIGSNLGSYQWWGTQVKKFEIGLSIPKEANPDHEPENTPETVQKSSRNVINYDENTEGWLVYDHLLDAEYDWYKDLGILTEDEFKGINHSP